jgi:hypothetical protein
VRRLVLLIKNRYNYEKESALKEELQTKTNDFLTDIIFSNYDAKSIKEKIKEFKEEVPLRNGVRI